jgi:hypothetical protein
MRHGYTQWFPQLSTFHTRCSLSMAMGLHLAGILRGLLSRDQLNSLANPQKSFRHPISPLHLMLRNGHHSHCHISGQQTRGNAGSGGERYVLPLQRESVLEYQLLLCV